MYHFQTYECGVRLILAPISYTTSTLSHVAHVLKSSPGQGICVLRDINVPWSTLIFTTTPPFISTRTYQHLLHNHAVLASLVSIFCFVLIVLPRQTSAHICFAQHFSASKFSPALTPGHHSTDHWPVSQRVSYIFIFYISTDLDQFLVIRFWQFRDGNHYFFFPKLFYCVIFPINFCNVMLSILISSTGWLLKLSQLTSVNITDKRNFKGQPRPRGVTG